ncbi:MAG TPA: sulfite exporter TauE/SafE family protein [Bacteroidota bacterium]
MDLLAWLLLLVGGCVAGFVAGCFGVGGGLFFVPILLAAYRVAGVTSLVAVHLAFGTSLLAVAFLAASSAYRSSRDGFIAWRTAAVMGAAAVAGAVAGAVLAGGASDATLKRVFGVLALVAAVQLFGERRKPRERPAQALESVRLAGAGAGAGFLSALGGTGGGMLTFPLLYSYFRLPLKKAYGTSAAVVAGAALAASAGYLFIGLRESLLPPGTLGYVDPLRALPLIVSSIPLALLGAARAERGGFPALRKLVGVVLVVLALAMLVAP